MGAAAVKAVLADVDGTLVTPQKALTERTVATVAQLRSAGVAFAVTSGRPPRGMSMLVAPLGLTTPIAAFNGGLIVHPDMSVVRARTIPDPIVAEALQLLQERSIDAWIYSGADWLVRDTSAPHVDREAATVAFAPTVVPNFDGVADVVKIVGISDDPKALGDATAAARQTLGDHVSAAQSQPYYLDITHPQANKGHVADYLCKHLGITNDQLATIGDMPNDVLMFARSGLSIAMGNASAEVQRAARRVTASNADEGFAEAMERFVLTGDRAD
jgi:Cof subfamily protein (haloacid dehalogenase superfamily)